MINTCGNWNWFMYSWMCCEGSEVKRAGDFGVGGDRCDDEADPGDTGGRQQIVKILKVLETFRIFLCGEGRVHPYSAAERVACTLVAQRRGWDSNPRWPEGHNGFRDRPIQPLWHLSEQRLGLYLKLRDSLFVIRYS